MLGMGVQNIAVGSVETGTMGSCETRELKFDRSRAVKGAEDKAISGISTLFDFQNEYDAAKVFFGIRVFAHRGIGPGRFYPSADCAKLFDDSGFAADMEPVLESAAPIIQ